MTNSDIYGYPEDHYSPPMEAIGKIEIIRGTASLQYGAQFGGMINYITKKPDTSRAITFESMNSVGSYGLFSSYNAIGGKIGKVSYYAYYQKRVSDGYRDNASSDSDAQFISLLYEVNSQLSLRAELGRSTYLYGLPGALTDSMFYANPRQSTRSRNYYSPDMYVPSITLDWKINPKTHLNLVTSAVLGTRSSVQFVGFANVPDTINSITDDYKNRQVDIDHFNSYTSELRLSRDYHIGKLPAVIAGGIRYIHNHMNRQQQGVGTTGSDYDLTLTEASFGRDMHLRTENVALFVENLLHITPRFNFSVGMRYENGITRMSGYIKYLDPGKVPLEIKHQFPLLGLSTQYQINNHHKLYSGWAQAYRPVIFADIIPPTVLDIIDPNLNDAQGYNAELGIKGAFNDRFHYDLSFFQIDYQNRIGTLAIQEDGRDYIFKTNTGNSLTRGIELYAEWKAYNSKHFQISLFTSSSYFDAFYKSGNVVVSNENHNIKGNKLESVPQWISRNGLQLAYKTFSANLQYSYVSESADAFNTEKLNATGTVGIVPSYGLWDLNFACRFAQRYVARFGINNLTNHQYFTKRPTMYPGPGIWSSDGRSIIFSLGIKI